MIRQRKHQITNSNLKLSNRINSSDALRSLANLCVISLTLIPGHHSKRTSMANGRILRPAIGSVLPQQLISNHIVDYKDGSKTQIRCINLPGGEIKIKLQNFKPEEGNPTVMLHYEGSGNPYCKKFPVSSNKELTLPETVFNGCTTVQVGTCQPSSKKPGLTYFLAYATDTVQSF